MTFDTDKDAVLESDQSDLSKSLLAQINDLLS